MMGGNALNGVCHTRRFERDEYLALEAEVIDKLYELAPNCMAQTIEAYRNKPSFGDMDILFWNEEPIHWPRVLTQIFNTKGYVKNGDVYSFEYKELQVDLIICSHDDYFTSAFYFAYNDLGNFIGRIAHKMGFKYGHRGLSFVLKDGDYQFDEIIVSRNSGRILEFLGYDFETFLAGFNELEDVFVYAASTPFFNKDIYLLHNRNHKSRIRDEKRKSYSAFLDWMELRNDLPAYPWQSMEERGGTKEVAEFIERAFTFFPSFKDEYLDSMLRFDRHKNAKALFNGDLVREWTGLNGPELGAVMKTFREQVESSGLSVTDYVLTHGQDHCRKVINTIKNSRLTWS